MQVVERMPVSRIAVGVDFSDESLRAVAHAMAVARHTGASLRLVHVGLVPEVTDDPAWRGLLAGRFEERRDQLTALGERLSGQGVEVSQLVYHGFSDTGLAEAAEETAVDLVVVGTHGRTGFRRALLGSVAEKTARLASMSVLVARGDAVAGGYRRVVVGTDHSPLAQRAVERALELTAPAGQVHVVHAWAAPYLDYDLGTRVLETFRAKVEERVADERDQILATPRRPDIDLRVELVDGSPVEVLERLSGSADLVAVGTHGRRGVRRFLLGSVAEATIRHARCTVLVAR